MMKKIACFLLLCTFLVGCDSYKYVDDYYDVAVSGMMENCKLDGKLMFSNLFEASSIRAFELDSSWRKIEEINVVLDSGDTSYHIDKRNYSNQLVQIVVSGTWKNIDSVGVPVTFEKIEDIITVETYDHIDLSLFDYLEIPRVKTLMKEGYPIEIAKEKAKNEIQKNFSEHFSYFLFSMGKSDSSFVENIENFRNDFANGSWTDYRDHIKTADYLTQNWQSFSFDDLKYYGRVQMESYGISMESRSGETFVIEDSTSAFYKDSLVCAGYGRTWVDNVSGGYDLYPHNILRPFTDLERKIGVCAFDSLKWVDKDTTVVKFEGETYKCDHELEISAPAKPDFESWRKVN